MLLLGRDDGDPLFLQVKEAERVGARAVPRRAPYANHGQRVVEGQRLMQAASDVLLGWVHADGRTARRDYYVRQLWDGKASARRRDDAAAQLRSTREVCGWTLARGHARSGDREAIAAYLGSGDRFDRAIADFAEAYADQNERDHAALAAAVEAGTIAADLDR